MEPKAIRSYIPHKRANRQYVALSNKEAWKFLDSKNKIFVAFPMKNRYPHVSPVWFCVIEGKIYFRTYDYKVKTGLASSGKACCTIDEGDSYKKLKGVIIWGKSSVVKDKSLIGRIDEVMDVRYKTQQWKESEMPKSWVADRKKERRAYVEIAPIKMSSWDNTKVESSFR